MLRAPDRPGFFRVLQGDVPLFTAAAHFADAREADFRGAAAREEPGRLSELTLTRNSREDPLTPVWLLALGALLTADWLFLARRRRSGAA
jgi:hypothetical protein